jgi:hypothetical protein
MTRERQLGQRKYCERRGKCCSEHPSSIGRQSLSQRMINDLSLSLVDSMKQFPVMFTLWQGLRRSAAHGSAVDSIEAG